MAFINNSRKANKMTRRPSALLLATLILILTPWEVWTAPCPKETPLFGQAPLTGSADEYETYFIVDDDDLT